MVLIMEIMISDDTEAWSNDAGNSALHHKN